MKYTEIKKTILDITTKPKQLDKLNQYYESYTFNRDELSPSDFCDITQVKETKVSYNQVRYWLFDDSLIDILWDELKPTSKKEKDLIKELVEQLMRIEGEKQLLAEEQKQLFSDYKMKLDIKAVKAAIRIAKLKSNVDVSDESLEEMVQVVESKIGV